MFSKVNDNSYLYQFDAGSGKEKCQIKFNGSYLKDSPIMKDEEFKYNLTLNMTKDFLDKNKTNFKLGAKTWTIRTEIKEIDFLLNSTLYNFDALR